MKGNSMKPSLTAVIVLVLSLGVALGQTPAKKTIKTPAKTAQQPAKTTVKKAAPAKAAKQAPATKKTTTKKTTAKTAQKADTTKVKQAEPPKVETAKTDTSATPSLKDYAKSKVDEAKATKDTMVQSGADKMTKIKNNLGEKIKNFDPFKPKADTTKK
jgi:hypothetical protein